MILLRPGESKHKIRGKSVGVALDRLVQGLGGDAVQFSKVGVHHNPLAANQKNLPVNTFLRNGQF